MHKKGELIFMMIEEWKRSRMCPDYEVNNYERVRDIKTKEKIGYTCVGNRTKVKLENDGKQKSYYIDELVADAFQDVNHENMKIIHRNDNRQDNTPDNLQWVPKRKSKSMKETYDRIKVRCIEADIIYESQDACSRALGIPVAEIMACCNDKSQKVYSKEFDEMYSFETVD